MLLVELESMDSALIKLNLSRIYNLIMDTKTGKQHGS